MSCTSSTIKFIMVLFNLAFVVLGSAVLVVGLSAKYDKDFGHTWGQVRGNALVDVTYINNLSWVLVAIGGFTFLLGIIGLVGSAFKIRALLVIYLILMILLLLVKLSLLYVVVQMNNHFDDDFHHVLNKTVSHFRQNQNDTDSIRNNTMYSDALANLQTTLKCCGLQGPSDYAYVNRDIPSSCYPNNSNVYYTDGCGDKVIAIVNANLPLITYVLIVVIAVETVAVAFAFFLCCHKKRKEFIDFE